jgi:arsenate reductase (glutaredoxin)
MEKVKIYHNPACSRSRGALEILEQRGIPHDVVEYLKTPPDRNTLSSFVDMIPDQPTELVRRDKRFTELGLDPDGYRTKEQVIDLLQQHPELMQRPVVVQGTRAVIARPSEKVLDLIG